MKEAFVVLSGGVEMKDNNWQLDYWSVVRCEVALKLWRLHSHNVILSGGVHRFHDVLTTPTAASLMRDYMVSHESSMSKRLRLEDKSSTTYEQLFNVAGLVPKRCELSVLSNNWHLPRIAALLACCSQVRTLVGRVRLIPVEAYIKTVDVSQEIIESEAKGIRAILCGSYSF